MAAVVPSACSEPHDLGGSSGVLSTGMLSASTSTSTSTSSGTDEGVDDTAGLEDLGGGGGGGGGFPCEMQGMFGSYTASVPDASEIEEHAEEVRPSIVCDFPELVDPDGMDEDRLSTNWDEGDEDTFDIFVYRPRDAAGDWPTTPMPHPAVFFAPGRGLRTASLSPTEPDDHYYYSTIQPLVEAGFVVFAIEPSSPDWGSGKRRAALACAMMWAKDSTNGWVAADDDRIGESAVLLGHSRGGTAVTRLTKSLLCQSSLDPVADGCCLAPDPCPAKDDLPTETALDTYEICSTVAIAPRWNEGANDAPTIQTIDAPPFLMIQGTLDEDTPGHGIPSYDTNVDEDLAVTSDPTTLRRHDKVGLWVYGPMHKTWGGDDPLTALGMIGLDQARATGPHFVEQFLRWQLFREATARDLVLAPTKVSPLQADFDAAVWDPSLWAAVSPMIAEYYEGDGVSLVGTGRPLVYADFTQGTLWPGAERFVIDNLARGTIGEDCDGDISPSTIGNTVSFSPLGAGNADICQGPANQIAPVPGSLVGSDHETEALAVTWGGPNAGVEAEWLLDDGSGPLDAVADYTHLTLRVGNPIESCPPTLDEFQLEVELESEGQDGAPVTATVVTDVIPDQHGEVVPDPSGLPTCPASHFMHTLRIPLTDFCDQRIGLDPSALTAVRVRFPESPDLHQALVDSLEFTRDPDEMAPQACPQTRTDWNCIASGTLVATERSCSGDPTPTCDPQDVTTAPVPLPWVDDGAGNGHSGWVVHAPRGWIDDPTAPTQTELDGIIDECIAACELEWADDPNVSANCAAPGAFTTPTLRTASGVGPVHMIPAHREQGAGLFANEELDCNLEGDCCLELDEDLCAARPTRPTAARQTLGRGEEVRVSIGGTTISKATFISPGGTVSTPIVGSAGYSLCSDDSTTCPFYVGSLSLTTTDTVTVTDTCPDSSPFSAVVTDLDVELLQPAFGIDAEGTLQQALPEGSLHLLGYISVDGIELSVRAINEDPVFLTAGPNGFLAGDLAVMLDAPCGDDTLPITVLIELRSAGTPLARPPAIDITTPTTVSCPGSLVLTHDASDPDGDLASVRWYLDDVLLSSSTSTLPFTRSHVLRAVARDARGATTTDAITVTCH